MRRTCLSALGQIRAMGGLAAIMGPPKYENAKDQAEFGPFASAGYSDGFNARIRQPPRGAYADKLYLETYNYAYDRGAQDADEKGKAVMSDGQITPSSTPTTEPITHQLYTALLLPVIKFAQAHPILAVGGVVGGIFLFKRFRRKKTA